MTDTAADELRTAAAKLRDRAKDATPGPWTAAHSSWAGDNAVLSYATNGHAVAVCGEEIKGADHPASADAAWIALMHPGRAERLAALLDDAAEFAQAFPDLSGEHVDGQPCGDYACRMVTRLRHLARDLNGTTRAATTPAPSAPEAPQAALNATETGEHPGPRVTGS